MSLQKRIDKISKNDIVFSSKDRAFGLAKKILTVILKNISLSNELKTRIEEYLSNGMIMNETLFFDLLEMLPGPLPGFRLSDKSPELLQEWHPTKNGKLKPCNVASGSGKKVWWKCDKEKDHEWRASPNTRTNTGKGCSCCSKRTIVESNCLATTHPKIAKQWHEKNSLTPFQVSSGSNKKVWWKCDVAPDHEWISTISNRLRQGCPCCSGRKVVRSNCLETTHPELVKEWSLENKFKPNQVVAGSGENILWQCSLNPLHKWYAKIYHRVKGSGCPICNSSHGEKLIEKILNENDLENNKTIIPDSEEEIIPSAPVEKVISRNVSTKRRNFR